MLKTWVNCENSSLISVLTRLIQPVAPTYLRRLFIFMGHSFVKPYYDFSTEETDKRSKYLIKSILFLTKPFFLF